MMRILNSGSSKPPKNPTIRISTVARVIMAGMLQISVPILQARKPAEMAEIAISTNLDMAIQCVQDSLSLSQSVSFSGGVRILIPYLFRLSTT